MINEDKQDVFVGYINKSRKYDKMNEGYVKNIQTANDIELELIGYADNTEYEEFKKVASEKWVRLSYLTKALDSRINDGCFSDDYRIALNWVKKIVLDI